MISNLNDYTIKSNASILDALEKLNANPTYTLFVIDHDNRMIGSLTDGDIRRGLLQGLALESPVCNFCHKQFHYLGNEQPSPCYIKELKELDINLVPILSEDHRIIRIINLQNIRNILPIDAVFMAGGRGERLRPLTDTTPKPLLPLGKKPIIAHNIERIRQYGISKLYISIRYLGSMIKERFKDGSGTGVEISYIEEDAPLGTIGAVSLVPHFSNDTVLVMNSDLFTNIDLEEFYFHFKETGSDMAVAAIPYNISVPYAVMEVNNTDIVSFKEKPTYTYMSNGGIYLIKRDILEKIPHNTRMDATDLIQNLLNQKKKVTYFPIIGYWIDIGKPEDYKKAQEFITYIEKR